MENSNEMLPEMSDGNLQQKADAIAALMFKFCVPTGYSDQERRYYFSTVAVNYAAVIEGYWRQRTAEKLQRVSVHQIQGVLQDPNEVNPGTHDKILERMDEPFYNYLIPIEDVRIAYFDYVLEKQIDQMNEQERTAYDLLEKIENGDLPSDQYDDLTEMTIRNKVYCEQLDDVSQGLSMALSMQKSADAREKASPLQVGMADLALKLVDFAEACEAFRPDMMEITRLLVDKPLLIHKVGLNLNQTNHLN